MTGPPGTGKTLMARAVAGEANATFFQTSGSEFEEEFVGVGARRIRDLFTEARKHKPCIIFVDELDAVGGKRSSRDAQYHRQTLNQLLVEVDGFKQNEGLVLIAATNFPESLDKALTRAGRLDKTVVLPLPDLRGRRDILGLYAKNITLDQKVDLSLLAQRTTGMTGADLSNILNIAAIRSSVDTLKAVPQKYLEEAFDRVVVGAERRSPMSEHEKNTTAYHEGGHTMVCLKLLGCDPVHKATIMPRGSALGITWSVPESEKFSHRLFEFQAKLAMMMGGRAAEELVFGAENVSAGCSSDLQKATELARSMVMNYGMGGGNESISMYFEPVDYQVLSDQAKNSLDNKIQSMLRSAYTRAVEVLRTNMGELHLLADALMSYETLDAQEINLAITGRKKEIEERHVNHTANLTPVVWGVELVNASANSSTVAIKAANLTGTSFNFEPFNKGMAKTTDKTMMQHIASFPFKVLRQALSPKKNTDADGVNDTSAPPASPEKGRQDTQTVKSVSEVLQVRNFKQAMKDMKTSKDTTTMRAVQKLAALTAMQRLVMHKLAMRKAMKPSSSKFKKLMTAAKAMKAMKMLMVAELTAMQAMKDKASRGNDDLDLDFSMPVDRVHHEAPLR